ncbi:MAG: diaminopimelate epimerase [Cyanobacteria bacterium SZAS LIN-5]|nr:diaminopimelate epimerase [Cyanobacteria bacterium SZAS LIN-5]RTL38768.1 MAG: diaminopimelate epimerase [Candidatus Melainabacteria bacterium]
MIPFTKMQGLGNDFVVIGTRDLTAIDAGRELLRHWKDRYSRFARAVCDRRFGIGADGLIVMVDFRDQPELREMFAYPDVSQSDVGWIYLNGDGSKSDMCGNGLRCAALWARNHFAVYDTRFTIATARGKSEIIYKSANEITINLGEPVLDAKSVPVKTKAKQFVNAPLNFSDLKATCVSMGNPHCVIFDAPPDAKLLGPSDSDDPAARFPSNYASYAPQIQSLDIFPEGVNVEFALIESESRVRLYVWERGCGATLACATGAAATVVAGVLEKKLARKVTVNLLGGSLDVEWSEKDNCVRLTGPANETFSGNFELSSMLDDVMTRGQREAICS